MMQAKEVEALITAMVEPLLQDTGLTLVAWKGRWENEQTGRVRKARRGTSGTDRRT